MRESLSTEIEVYTIELQSIFLERIPCVKFSHITNYSVRLGGHFRTRALRYVPCRLRVYFRKH